MKSSQNSYSSEPHGWSLISQYGILVNLTTDCKFCVRILQYAWACVNFVPNLCCLLKYLHNKDKIYATPGRTGRAKYVVCSMPTNTVITWANTKSWINTLTRVDIITPANSITPESDSVNRYLGNGHLNPDFLIWASHNNSCDVLMFICKHVHHAQVVVTFESIQ